MGCFETDDLSVAEIHVYQVENAETSFSEIQTFVLIEGTGFNHPDGLSVRFPGSAEDANGTLVDASGTQITVPVPSGVANGSLVLSTSEQSTATSDIDFSQVETLTDVISPEVTLLAVFGDTSAGTYTIDFSISDDTAVTIVSSVGNELLSFADGAVFFSGLYRLDGFSFADSDEVSIKVADFAGNVSSSNSIHLP
jgi:hypothetical protein